MLHLHEIDHFLPKKPFMNHDLNLIIYSRNMKKKSKFKIFEVIKFMCKTIFSHFLLIITLNDTF